MLNVSEAFSDDGWTHDGMDNNADADADGASGRR